MNNHIFKSVVLFWRILWKMSVAQLKSRYAGSSLGVSWAIINPLLMMVAISFVFTCVFKAGIKDYSFFVLSGIIPWMFFSNALSESTGSIVGQQAVMRQFNFPTVILPLSSVLVNFMNFLISWIVIYPLFVFFNPKIIFLFPLFPIILFFHLLLVIGFCLMLSVLNVFFRDIGHLLGVVLMFWFWVTPVFYSMDMVPVQFLWIYDINPVTPYVVYYENIIFNGTVPSAAVFIRIVLWAIVSLLSGIMIFKKLEPKLAKKL